MKQAILFLIVLVYVGCAVNHNSVRDSNKINGSWIPLRQEIGGKSLPEIVLKSQKLILKDSCYTVLAESIDKGVVRMKGNKMDIFGKEGVNAGKHFTAIYKYENNELTICYDLTGKNYPESYDSKSSPLLFLSVFRRETEK